MGPVTGVTLAVKVTASPYVDGLEPEVNAVLVLIFTVTTGWTAILVPLPPLALLCVLVVKV